MVPGENVPDDTAGTAEAICVAGIIRAKKTTRHASNCRDLFIEQCLNLVS
jgi:hypothetical protein